MVAKRGEKADHGVGRPARYQSERPVFTPLVIRPTVETTRHAVDDSGFDSPRDLDSSDAVVGQVTRAPDGGIPKQILDSGFGRAHARMFLEVGSCCQVSRKWNIR